MKCDAATTSVAKDENKNGRKNSKVFPWLYGSSCRVNIGGYMGSFVTQFKKGKYNGWVIPGFCSDFKSSCEEHFASYLSFFF